MKPPSPRDVSEISLAPESLETYIEAGMATASNSIAPTTQKQVNQCQSVLFQEFKSVYSFQYSRCWTEWTRFCNWYVLDPLSASVQDLLGYLNYVSRHHSSSLSTAHTHVSSIAYHYRVQGLTSITDHALVKMYLRGVKRANLDVPVRRYVKL